MKKLFDVVIVGGGGSGLATGVSAAQNGASVIVLEKRPELGCRPLRTSRDPGP
jgi:flavin-dependent dehydrogenase